jgi:uncharacterized membrane protein
LESVFNPLFFVRFYEPTFPEEQSQFPYAIFFAGIVGGLLFGVGGMFWMIRRREKKAVKAIGTTLLSESQIELIRVIYRNDGKVSQKQLCDITGFSKSKISRNIVPLEERGLVRRQKWGRTYVVYLSDSGKAVVE